MGLGTARGLGMAGVPVILLSYSPTDSAIASRYVQKTITVPHPEHEEARFIETLIRLVRDYTGAVIFPTSDAALSIVSQHKAELEAEGAIPACTEWEITQLFLDKMHTYRLAEEIGVPAPRTAVLRTMDDVEACGRTFLYPGLLKPRQSHQFYAHFGTKMFTVNNFDELVDLYQKAQNVGDEVLLQEIVVGPDSNGANYNSYHFNGAACVEFTAQKVRSGPPWWGSPRVLITRDIPELHEPGRKILNAMGYYGFQCSEYKRDERDGVYKLIEVNGRHNLSSMLAIHTGINFPYLHYQHLAEGIMPQQTAFTKDIYWIDLSRDVGYSVKYFRQEKYPLGEYLRPYFRKHIFAILSAKDPMPFAKRWIDMAKKVLGLKRYPTHKAKTQEMHAHTPTTRLD
jgi:predicted ATP-grasp superfamily ATP-dependent carboligase